MVLKFLFYKHLWLTQAVPVFCSCEERVSFCYDILLWCKNHIPPFFPFFLFFFFLIGGRETERMGDGSGCWTLINLWDLVSTTTRPLNVKHSWSVHSATGSCMTCACLSWNNSAKMCWVVFLLGFFGFSLFSPAWFVLSASAFQCFAHAWVMQSWRMAACESSAFCNSGSSRFLVSSFSWEIPLVLQFTGSSSELIAY